MLLAFFILSLLQVYNRVSQNLCDVWYHNRLTAEAYIKTQLFSIKTDAEKICKNVKQLNKFKTMSLVYFFGMENIPIKK